MVAVGPQCKWNAEDKHVALLLLIRTDGNIVVNVLYVGPLEECQKFATMVDVNHFPAVRHVDNLCLHGDIIAIEQLKHVLQSRKNVLQYQQELALRDMA